MTNSKKFEIYKNRSIAELTKIYNSSVDKKDRIKKFRDKATALARLKDLTISPFEESSENLNRREKMTETPKTPPGGIASNKKLSESPVKKESSISTSTLVGKRSKYKGKYIYKQVKENPRNKETHGWHAWEKMSDGMSYDEYIKVAGEGAARHLLYNIRKGFVEVTDKK